MPVSHYDSFGNKIGSSSDDNGFSAVTLLFIASGVFSGFYKVFIWSIEKISNWETFSAPYSYMASFYHYVLVFPVRTSVDIKNWLFTQPFTEYPNINATISILGVLSYIFFLVAAVGFLIRFLDRFGSGVFMLLCFLFSPAAICLVWYFSVESFEWLTVTA